MLNRTWKIILLIVALLLAIWPGLLGASASQWIAAIVLVVLLIAEIMCAGEGKSRRKETEMPAMARERSATAARAPARRSRSTSRRRR